MKVLVACEFSGVVRDAFIKRGHDAISCDLLPTDRSGPHYVGDVFDIINDGWDLMIAHPPCTHLACSGAAHFAKKRADGRQQQGIDFFMRLASTNIHRWALENPVGIMSRHFRAPNQIIHPYHFGHPVSKSTCLWTHRLPRLVPTNVVAVEWHTGKDGKRHSMWDYKISMNHKERAHLRSQTFQGIADAMADQWGCL